MRDPSLIVGKESSRKKSIFFPPREKTLSSCRKKRRRHFPRRGKKKKKEGEEGIPERGKEDCSLRSVGKKGGPSPSYYKEMALIKKRFVYLVDKKG